jgi:exopolysaccharide biosynthesis polyprenyl glycosylphosphotransferase
MLHPRDVHAFTVSLGNNLPQGVWLPDADVRTRFNERAMRRWTESSRRLLRLITLATIDSAAGLLGVWTVLNTWSFVSGGGKRPLPDDIPLIAMVFCLQPLTMRLSGAHAGGKARTDVLKIGAGVAAAAVLGWIQAQLFGRDVPTLPNKAAYLYSVLTITAYAWVSRLFLDRVVRITHQAGILQRRVLVVGSAAEAQELNRRCLEMPGSDVRVVGRVHPKGLDSLEAELEALTSPHDVRYLGDVDSMERALSRTGAQGVVVTSSMSVAGLEGLVGNCFRLGATVSVLPQALKTLAGTHIEVRQSAAGWLLQLTPLQLDVPQLAVKRVMDAVLTVAALVALWPLLALIAIAIKLDSRGPVLFGQERAGVGGKPFRMLKFRTMRNGADADKLRLQHLNQSGDPRLFKIKNDPRITWVGRFLRRTSLDELPQMVNVLRGEMSLVGPRPFFPTDLAGYEVHHFERLHVLPGITGLWQVSGRSDVVNFEEVIRLDRQYIENWSVLTDIRILLRTIPAAFGRGAY